MLSAERLDWGSMLRIVQVLTQSAGSGRNNGGDREKKRRRAAKGKRETISITPKEEVKTAKGFG